MSKHCGTCGMKTYGDLHMSSECNAYLTGRRDGKVADLSFAFCAGILATLAGVGAVLLCVEAYL